MPHTACSQLIRGSACPPAFPLHPRAPPPLPARARQGFQEREKLRDAFTDFQTAVLLCARCGASDPEAGGVKSAATKGLQEMVKWLNQQGDGKWVRENRRT